MWITDKQNNCSIYVFCFSYRDEKGYFLRYHFHCPEGRFTIDERRGLVQRLNNDDSMVLDPSIKLCKSDSGIRRQILKIHERLVSGDLSNFRED